MDLGAYSNIEKLAELAEKNNIQVPRLRGYRLMKDEELIDPDVIYKDTVISVMEGLIRSNFIINSCMCEYSARTNKAVNKYIDRGATIRWDLLHGKKRKVVKYVLKKHKRKVEAQYEMWNKYCGREDVLYIHSRIGGLNWNFYHGDDLRKEPWFLDKVDDSFDGTYCDIYAKITEA